VGSVLPVAFQLPSGGTRTVPLRVVGIVALPTAIGGQLVGLGTGATITLGTYRDIACGTGSMNVRCLSSIGNNVAVLASAEPGPRGRAAIQHYLTVDSSFASAPPSPTGLVNFGEAVNFPLIFGVMLAIFGVATLIHLLLISLGRRRHEMGVLKAVGFLAGQVRAAVIWQAMTVVLIGVVVGAPLGIALGRAIWKAFAVNIGVVPVPIAPILPLAVLLVSVLGAAIVLATPTAVLASRAQPSEVLRSQ